MSEKMHHRVLTIEVPFASRDYTISAAQITVVAYPCRKNKHSFNQPYILYLFWHKNTCYVHVYLQITYNAVQDCSSQWPCYMGLILYIVLQITKTILIYPVCNWPAKFILLHVLPCCSCHKKCTPQMYSMD